MRNGDNHFHRFTGRIGTDRLRKIVINKVKAVLKKRKVKNRRNTVDELGGTVLRKVNKYVRTSTN